MEWIRYLAWGISAAAGLAAGISASAKLGRARLPAAVGAAGCYLLLTLVLRGVVLGDIGANAVGHGGGSDGWGFCGSHHGSLGKRSAAPDGADARTAEKAEKAIEIDPGLCYNNSRLLHREVRLWNILKR